MPTLKNLEVDWVSLVDRAAVRQAENPDQPQRFLVWKRDTTPTDGGDMPTDTLTPEQIQANLEKAETDRDAALQAVTKAEGERDTLTARVAELEKAAKKPPANDDESTDEADMDDVAKAQLPENVRKHLAKRDAADAELRGRLEKAEKAASDSDTLAKAERDERLTRDFIAKAEQMKALPAKAQEFGPILKRAADTLSADDFAALETVLKAADEQIRAGKLFEEHGAGGEAKKSGAYEEALGKAQELRKSDSKLSQSDAIDRVFKEDRKLEERYLAENR